MTKNDLTKLIASLEATSNLENVSVLLKQRERYCLITQALTKKIDRITKQIERLSSPVKDLLNLTDAILNPTEPKPEPKLVSFGKTGLASGAAIKVILTYVRKTGGRYQFVFEDPNTGKQFQLSRPCGPWSTGNALKVIQYTLKHCTGQEVDYDNLQTAMDALCNKPLSAKVVIFVQPVSGALNWQTRASW
jgi:hypothetical protein